MGVYVDREEGGGIGGRDVLYYKQRNKKNVYRDCACLQIYYGKNYIKLLIIFKLKLVTLIWTCVFCFETRLLFVLIFPLFNTLSVN